MRHLVAASAALLVLLASASASATTPWNTGPDFNVLHDVSLTRHETIRAGDGLYWRPEDTAPSPPIIVGPGGAVAVWDSGSTSEALTIWAATGSASAPGSWKAYGDPLVSTGDCVAISSCAIRFLLPGVYRFDTTNHADDGQLKLTGGQ